MTGSSPARPARRTRRRVGHAWSYGPVLRPADRRAGKRDGRAVAGRPVEPASGGHGTPWSDRLTATWQENDSRMLARTADRLAPAARRLRLAFGEVGRLDGLLAELVADPAPEPEPAARRGEAHLTDQELQGRRAGERARVIAAHRARIAELRTRRDALLAECSALGAEIAEEFEVAREVSCRMRWFYARRLHTYARAWWSAAATSTSGFAELPASTWADRPCPWLPPGLTERLATTAAAVLPETSTEGAGR